MNKQANKLIPIEKCFTRRIPIVMYYKLIGKLSTTGIYEQFFV